MIYSMISFSFFLNCLIVMNGIVEVSAQIDSYAILPLRNETATNRFTTTPTFIQTNPLIITTVISNSFQLQDSNCFCLYDPYRNLLSCSPSLRNASAISTTNPRIPVINVTLYDCIFNNHRFNLPKNINERIDHLQLYDINRQDYLLFDETSFKNYQINHLFIYYTLINPVTMLLFSEDSFPPNSLEISLKSLYIDSCYLVKLDRPFRRLRSLESLTLIDIDGFSWQELRQEIFLLNRLRSISISDKSYSPRKDIANVISCDDLLPNWSLIYRSLQTCSCQLMTLLRTTVRLGEIYRCVNKNQTIDFLGETCLLNGSEFSTRNQSNRFCRNCQRFVCSLNDICIELDSSIPQCLTSIPDDYQLIRRRIPLNDWTRKYLLKQSQNFLTMNPNRTLEAVDFYSVATVLIDSNANKTVLSTTDAYLFHQTFSEILARPWSTEIYSISANSPTPLNWGDLFMSLDESVKTIDDSETQFQFNSPSISTLSLRYPNNQSLQKVLRWKISMDNQIIANTTTNEYSRNVTSRILLYLDPKEPFLPLCNLTGQQTNCTNRFSVTAIKASKLFYKTNRIPTYDVISIVAPSINQRVLFHFDQKISTENLTDENQTNQVDPFYDQLNSMVTRGTCMYLNTNQLTWQTDGCQTERSSSSDLSVTCTCEHLTMFTVFFSLECTTPSVPLVVLSWIGCSLSLIGLVFALFLFIFISQCRQNVKKKSSSQTSSTPESRNQPIVKSRRLSLVKSMLFILCILLIAMNIFIFILSLIKSLRNLTCAILSALLYYFTLAAFIWKFLFAIQQSLFLTNVFQSHWSHQRLLILYLSITICLPLIPLIIMFVQYPNFTFISSKCNFCWLTREFLLYGLMVPILCLVVMNYILFAYTIIYLCVRNRQQANLRSTKSDHSRQIQNFKIALFFASVMGLGWIFAFLLLIPNSQVQFYGNIFFCIVNSLQGFLFSLMMIFMLERKLFEKFCCCLFRRKLPKKSDSDRSIIPEPSARSLNDDGDSNRDIYQKASILTVSTNATSDHGQPQPEIHRNRTTKSPQSNDHHRTTYTPSIF